MIGENAQFLTDLDAAIGDADHGINMDRGMTAVLGALDEAAPADMAALCKQVGMTLVKSVGGASGPLYGTFFLRMAGALGAGESVDAADFAQSVARRRRGRGAARPRRSGRQDDVRRAGACAGRARRRAGIRRRSRGGAAPTPPLRPKRAATQPNPWSPARAAPATSGSAASAIMDPGATSAAMLIAAAASAFATGG